MNDSVPDGPVDACARAAAVVCTRQEARAGHWKR